MFFRVLIAACLLLAALDGAFAQGVDNQPSAASGEQPGANEVRTEQPSLAEQNKQQAAEYRPDCKRPQDDKEADLCEQRRMAKAAEDAVVVASDQYWLAWLTFGALVLTVAFTACAAVAGALTVCAMRDTTKRQLRAYVHIEDVKIVQANDDRFSPNIQIIIKNFGGTPAYDVRNTFMCRPMISVSLTLKWLHWATWVQPREHSPRLFIKRYFGTA